MDALSQKSFSNYAHISALCCFESFAHRHTFICIHMLLNTNLLLSSVSIALYVYFHYYEFLNISDIAIQVLCLLKRCCRKKYSVNSFTKHFTWNNTTWSLPKRISKHTFMYTYTLMHTYMYVNLSILSQHKPKVYLSRSILSSPEIVYCTHVCPYVCTCKSSTEKVIKWLYYIQSHMDVCGILFSNDCVRVFTFILSGTTKYAILFCSKNAHTYVFVYVSI